MSLEAQRCFDAVGTSETECDTVPGMGLDRTWQHVFNAVQCHLHLNDAPKLRWPGLALANAKSNVI